MGSFAKHAVFRTSPTASVANTGAHTTYYTLEGKVNAQKQVKAVALEIRQDMTLSAGYGSALTKTIHDLIANVSIETNKRPNLLSGGMDGYGLKALNRLRRRTLVASNTLNMNSTSAQSKRESYILPIIIKPDETCKVVVTMKGVNFGGSTTVSSAIAYLRIVLYETDEALPEGETVISKTVFPAAISSATEQNLTYYPISPPPNLRKDKAKVIGFASYFTSGDLATIDFDLVNGMPFNRAPIAEVDARNLDNGGEIAETGYTGCLFTPTPWRENAQLGLGSTSGTGAAPVIYTIFAH